MTIKLNADGSLGEGTTKIEDKTLQTLLEFAPAKDLIGLAKGVSIKEMVTPETDGIDFTLLGEWREITQLQLTITQKDYRRVRTAYTKYTGAESTSERIETPVDSAAKKDGGDALEFSGSVRLPEKKEEKAKP